MKNGFSLSLPRLGMDSQNTDRDMVISKLLAWTLDNLNVEERQRLIDGLRNSSDHALDRKMAADAALRQRRALADLDCRDRGAKSFEKIFPNVPTARKI